ncbi:MAG: hypothetical protein IT303_11335 [Dehalococcoidia bacterium]|nr:hypothetical protein [Dehalococcoidia bacterium]
MLDIVNEQNVAAGGWEKAADVLATEADDNYSYKVHSLVMWANGTFTPACGGGSVHVVGPATTGDVYLPTGSLAGQQTDVGDFEVNFPITALLSPPGTCTHSGARVQAIFQAVGVN